MKIRHSTLIGSLILYSVGAAGLRAQSGTPLTLINTFNLSDAVSGRFDHSVADITHNRLFVVTKDYKAVLVLDLSSGKVLHTIDGLGEPQGLLYRDDLNTLYVADGVRGTLEIIDGKTYEPKKSFKLRLNADSVAYDPSTKYLYIVNGGADAKMTDSVISIIDTTLGTPVGEIKVDGDTLEAMALEKLTSTMYVDNRAKNEVEKIDRTTNQTISTWKVTLGKTMVGIALDEASHRLFVGCRDGYIVVFDTVTGKEMQALSIGEGLDDLAFDVSTKRLYAACGSSGTVDAYEEVDADHYRPLGKVPTGPLARTGLLVSSLKRYFVAVPKSASENAKIMVYQVQ
jgi:DNA-binding beta-propeller fold protein YncE